MSLRHATFLRYYEYHVRFKTNTNFWLLDEQKSLESTEFF